MSRLVSRILLAVLMIPAAIIVYVISIFVARQMLRPSWNSRTSELSVILLCGVATWAFVAVYWFVLWRSAVNWTVSRKSWTLAAILGSIFVAGLIGSLLNSFERDFGQVMGSVIAPVVWLMWVTLLWRETPLERTERLRSMDASALVCPSCGYNLTGLQGTRCPECGTLYTLNELIAGQPARVDADIPE